MNNRQTIIDAMNDPEMLKKMAEANSIEEIQALLAKEGIEVSAEEIEAIVNNGNEFGARILKADGELDVEALEQVAGGGPIGGAILATPFLFYGAVTRNKRAYACAGAAFLIGCIAPCP